MPLAGRTSAQCLEMRARSKHYVNLTNPMGRASAHEKAGQLFERRNL